MPALSSLAAVSKIPAVNVYSYVHLVLRFILIPAIMMYNGDIQPSGISKNK